MVVGRFDHRLRCASSLKSKTTLPRWPSSSVARNLSAAAVISPAALSVAGVRWANVSRANQAPANARTDAAMAFRVIMIWSFYHDQSIDAAVCPARPPAPVAAEKFVQ